jgi:DNA-binding transcriptional ArsR family regulator
MSQVTAVCGEVLPGVDHAGAALLALVRHRSRPVVELAADADLPLTVVRVLLGDLAEAGLVRVDVPRRVVRDGVADDPELLREIIERLREL